MLYEYTAIKMNIGVSLYKCLPHSREIMIDRTILKLYFGSWKNFLVDLVCANKKYKSCMAKNHRPHTSPEARCEPKNSISKA